MILPTNLDINKNIEKQLTAATSMSTTSTNSVTSGLSTNGATAAFNLDIDILDKSAIKKETYYKMKYIMNSLDKNWAIKKRENVFYLKNLDNSTNDIITEDYLNKRVIQKIYSEAIVKTTSSDDINKEIKKQATHMAPESVTNMGTTMGTKKKEDIISLKDGILALKELMNKETMDMNKELRQEIYIMIFLMNALESGWSIRKKDNKFVFRKRHNHRKEVYSDNYLVNFLKNNLKNIVF
jgi:primase-polymerase (primpol)-like protein